MPPIKRTKFKLTPDQLLEMFYWVKLIRAFDERLLLMYQVIVFVISMIFVMELAT